MEKRSSAKDKRAGAYRDSDTKADQRLEQQKDAMLRRATRLAREVFDIPAINSLQRQCIENFYDNRDLLIVAPTGGGKSLCFLLPALLTGEKVLVISPLIALIREQAQKWASLGLACAAIDSGMSREEREFTLQDFRDGLLRILYISPERLARPSFRQELSKSGVSLVAIDEAHCISHWGGDFRPEYRKLGSYIAHLNSPKIMALTATAPRLVQEEILSSLGLSKAKVIKADPLRSNIETHVLRFKSQKEQLDHIIADLHMQEGPGIIYAPTRAKVSEMAEALTKVGASFTIYHAGLSQEERQRNQDQFANGGCRIMVATNSFGMGIDKDDIEFVYHFGMPASLESYLQEIGRAGRNGARASATLYYGPKDFFLQNFMLKKALPESVVVKEIYSCCQEILFSRPSGISEAELLERLEQGTGYKRDDIETALAYLLREEVFHQFRDPGIGEETLVFLAETPMSEDGFWSQYEKVCALKKARLRAMFDYVKLDGDRQAFLEEYFNA